MWKSVLCFLFFVTAPVLAEDEHPRPFDAAIDARGEVNAALSRAANNDTRVLLVFGANWCHDSRGLAHHFAQDDMQDIISRDYELVWVDVGWRHHNLDILRDMGAHTLYGTPTVLIIDPELGLLNSDTMHTWHTAYSRDHDEVVRYFRQWAFARPGAGVVEASATYAGLAGQIDAWEAQEGARLSSAYIAVRQWRDRVEADDRLASEEADLVAAERQIDQHRGRMREDRNQLYAQARNRVRDALFELGSDLTPELAAELDGNAPDITLDFPDYSHLRFPGEG